MTGNDGCAHSGPQSPEEAAECQRELSKVKRVLFEKIYTMISNSPDRDIYRDIDKGIADEIDIDPDTDTERYVDEYIDKYLGRYVDIYIMKGIDRSIRRRITDDIICAMD